MNRAIFVRDVDSAAQLYDEISSEAPDYVMRGPVQFDLARLLEQHERHDLAYRAHVAIAEKQKENTARPQSLKAAGILAFKLDKFEECLKFLEEFLDTKPTTPDRVEAEETLSRLPANILKGRKKSGDGSDDGVKLDGIPTSWHESGGKPVTFEWKVDKKTGDSEPPNILKKTKSDPPHYEPFQSLADPEPEESLKLSSGTQIPTEPSREDPVQFDLSPQVQTPPAAAPPPPPPQAAPPPQQAPPPPGYYPPQYPGYGAPPSGYYPPPGSQPYPQHGYPPPHPAYGPPHYPPHNYPPPAQPPYGYGAPPPVQPPPPPDQVPRLSPPGPLPKVDITPEAKKEEPVAKKVRKTFGARKKEAEPAAASPAKSPSSGEDHALRRPAGESPEARYERLRDAEFALLLPVGKRIHLESVAELVAKYEGMDEGDAKKKVLRRKGILYHEMTLDEVLDLQPLVKKCRQSLLFVNVPRHLKPYENYDVLGAEMRQQGLKLTTDTAVRRVRWADVRLINCGTVIQDVVVTLLTSDPVKEYRFISRTFNYHTFSPSGLTDFRTGVTEFLELLAAKAGGAVKSHTVENLLKRKMVAPQPFSSEREFYYYNLWILYSRFGEVVDADELMELSQVSSNW